MNTKLHLALADFASSLTSSRIVFQATLVDPPESEQVCILCDGTDEHLGTCPVGKILTFAEGL